MKKILFYLSLVVVLCLVIGTDFMNLGIDIEAKARVWHRGVFILIPIALLLAAGYIIFFRKTFPLAWSRQTKRGQIGIGIIILIFCIGITFAGTITLDVILPYKKKEQLGGFVVTKYLKKNNRSTQYMLRVLFLHAGGSREFEVRQRVYDKFNPGDNINSWFYTGPFGTVYMRIQ